ncbi:MAG: FAD-dependent oxidoreductase, partial [Myxococcales bacterium]|nr:FAD-dependent oxidoreductase [Myxococcales bacterium]
MTEMSRIAVVGASLAGLRAVEFIRRAKFEGELVLIGDEEHLPYDRPPLSKEVLRGEWASERLSLRRKSYDDLNVDLVLGRRAVSLDTETR